MQPIPAQTAVVPTVQCDVEFGLTALTEKCEERNPFRVLTFVICCNFKHLQFALKKKHFTSVKLLWNPHPCKGTCSNMIF